MKKVWIIILVLAILVIGGGRLGIHVMSKNLAQRVTINDIEYSHLADGIYEGSYTEEPLIVEVSVTIRDGKITDIEILRHEHGMGTKGERVVDLVISEQSLNVDTISGATASSKVILKAIEEALSQGSKN